MPAVNTKDRSLPRRLFLRNLGGVTIGLPPLLAMFNSTGTAYAAAANTEIPTRFALWFNGNGIVEKYWIPAETGADFTMTPCLAPLAPFRNDIHVVTGLDNPSARLPGPGNDHHRSMASLMSGTQFTGRGSGGPSIDQAIAARVGGENRFRSLQVGVSQESFGESIQRNMSWAGYDRSLPPEMLPRVFDKLETDPGKDGTGLGLAIVKQIVEAHGGAASVASTLGAGAVFTVTLPPAVR